MDIDRKIDRKNKKIQFQIFSNAWIYFEIYAIFYALLKYSISIENLRVNRGASRNLP